MKTVRKHVFFVFMPFRKNKVWLLDRFETKVAIAALKSDFYCTATCWLVFLFTNCE